MTETGMQMVEHQELIKNFIRKLRDYHATPEELEDNTQGFMAWALERDLMKKYNGKCSKTTFILGYARQWVIKHVFRPLYFNKKAIKYAPLPDDPQSLEPRFDMAVDAKLDAQKFFSDISEKGEMYRYLCGVYQKHGFIEPHYICSTNHKISAVHRQICQDYAGFTGIGETTCCREKTI